MVNDMKKKEFVPISVLVVDDSPESVELIKRNLQSKGTLPSSVSSLKEKRRHAPPFRSDLRVWAYASLFSYLSR